MAFSCLLPSRNRCKGLRNLSLSPLFQVFKTGTRHECLSNRGARMDEGTTLDQAERSIRHDSDKEPTLSIAYSPNTVQSLSGYTLLAAHLPSPPQYSLLPEIHMRLIIKWCRIIGWEVLPSLFELLFRVSENTWRHQLTSLALIIPTCNRNPIGQPKKPIAKHRLANNIAVVISSGSCC